MERQLLDLRRSGCGRASRATCGARSSSRAVTLGGSAVHRRAEPGRGAAASSSRRATACTCGCAFEASSTGPCHRCLEPARVPVKVRRERVSPDEQTATQGDDQLVSDYVDRDQVDVAALGARRAGARDPGEDPVPARLRRLVRRCGARLRRRSRPRLRRRRARIPAGRSCATSSGYNFAAAWQSPRRKHPRPVATSGAPALDLAPTLSECPQCHHPVRPHHACPNCGHYRGREVEPLAEVAP